ncbi:glycosyltransferase family 4 protein [Moorena sp. SIO4G3]|uniref:glycosyltransferase family 4 protein n=1 Tax=Moorena sp. SIO4G3 TaxID=2607821 RepID=UPI00142BE3E0|nr:glycosyltransferase family 4 protein [Moorena sp. SIO4G3]NEO76398.1 glycosyltransferase family 4 protein [Moorena sp. SIO4G3]
MKRRRVLFVDHAAVLGGAELSLLDLATAYRDTSEVLLFADGPFRERLEAAQVKVKVIPAPQAILSVRSSGGLSAALKALPPLWWMACRIAAVGREFELVHANSQKAFIAAAIATLMGGPPVVWHLRDIVTAPHFSSLNRAIAVFLANRLASQILVNSRATGQAFITAGGREDLVTLVYGGIASDPFDKLVSDQSAQIRDQLGIGDAPLVGLFSRLSYWKGQHILLEALQELPNVHALLVGKALFGEAEYASRLEAMAAAPELAGRVHMLGFRNDVPALMSACNIVLHTSTEPEPFGRVIVEGQLAKRPVVAAAAGGAVELIQDGDTGHLVTPGDPVALAKVIGKLLSDPSAADSLAERGYIHAKSTFSLESLLMTFDQALNKV